MFFLADIAFMLELLCFCLGLVFLHHCKEDKTVVDTRVDRVETRKCCKGLVRVAGVILIIGSIILAICTSMGVYEKRNFIKKEYAGSMRADRDNVNP